MIPQNKGMKIKMDEEEIKRTMQFVVAAISACKEPNVNYQFTCPLCGGEAHVIMSGYNGAHIAQCFGCDMNFME